MTKQQMDGVWVIMCDWVNPETGKPCDLGLYGEPKMFVDPDSGKDPRTHYQCGTHHGIVKQEDDPDFQLPKDHELTEETESTIITDASVDPNKKHKKIELEGFKPDATGRVWDGRKLDD